MASRTAPPVGPPTRPVPRPGRLPRLRARLAYEPLLRNGHVLTLSSLLTAGLGALFWVLATSWYDASVIGRSYAVISAVTLLAGIGQLNLNDVLVRFVPSAGRHTRRVLLRAYGAAALASAVAAAVFLVLVPTVAPDLAHLRGPLAGGCFVLATAGYALFILQDGALTGLRRTDWVLGENALFAVVKTAALPLAALLFMSAGILLSWTVALVAAVVAANWFLLRRAVPAHAKAHPREHPPERMVGYAAADYAGALCRLSAYNVVPLLVLNMLGPAPNAYFSISWVIAYTLFQAAFNMGSSMIVEAAHRPDRLTEQARKVLRHCLWLLGAGVVVVLVAAPWLLSLFGADYADHAATLLRLLALAALPNLLLDVAIDVARARRRLPWAVALQAALCVLVLGGCVALLPVLGLTGVGVAWLGAECLLALPLLITLRRWLPRPAPAEAPSRRGS